MTPTPLNAFRRRDLTQLNALAGHLRAQLLPDLRPTDALPVAGLLRIVSGRPVHIEGTELRVRAYHSPHMPSTSAWASTRLLASGRILLAFCSTGWTELQAGVGRSKFSALHELAHALLHHKELATFGSVPHAEGTATNGDWCLERQANRLAGALLMPGVALRQLASRDRLTVPELVARYGVTPMAAERRIAEVG